jgi:elongation factor G
VEDISRLRNIAVVGTHHSGKTTLVETILATCGAISRRGSVADGTTTTDFEPECIEHLQSTCVGFAYAMCGAVDLNLIDCPGFIDFFEETKIALLAADAALIVIEPDPGRIGQTQSLVDFIEAHKLPHLFLVNKMDRPGADFLGTLAALQQAYGMHVVAQQIPIGAGETYRGFVDLAENKAYLCNECEQDETEIPADLQPIVSEQRTKLLEALGDFDDHLLEELLDGIEPSREEIRRDLCEDCSHDRIIPVLAASGLTGAGIRALLETIEREFPSPEAEPRHDSAGRLVAPDPHGPVVAQVCKTFVHPQSGKLSVVRVFSGTITADTPLVDASRGGVAVRPSGLFRLQGKRQDAVKSAIAGSIVALGRLEGVATGDTLTSPNANVTMPMIEPAEPLFALAIRPKEKLDEAKLSQMLARIIDEDPSLRVARAEFTNELQLLGNGEIHVKTATERLSRKYHLALETAQPTIPYRETITSSTEIHARYKHQTGGHGQFGDVWLRIEPRPRGHGITFDEQIVGGVVPKQFIPAVEKGVREALLHGPKAGFPVVDLHVTLFDGAYHAVDSSEASFKTAAAMAIRDGLPKCNPVILEPIVRLEIQVPSAYASTIVSQLTAKRGQILSYEADEQRPGYEKIIALVPQVELGRYITERRTASQGLGTFTWRHERFEIVPDKVAQTIKEPAMA